MKRIICALLAALVCLVFPGCEEKTPEKLRICFDVGESQDLSALSNVGSLQKAAAEAFAGYLDDCDKYLLEGITSQDIELELIPSDETQSTERAAALQRIRTEIMSGGGPDVFLCKAAPVEFLSGERLFPTVERAVQDGLFLPLDELMERAVLTNFSELCAPVLAGGKDPDGRQAVLPMSYTIGVDIYRRADLPAYDSAGKTWEDVLNGDDPVLAAQAGWMFSAAGELPEGNFLYDVHAGQLPLVFPGLMDFTAGKLTMTEEELAAQIKRALAAYRRYLEQETALAKASLALSPYLAGEIGDQEVTFVPLRNSAGGVTAEVTLYCAVNKNTKQPERAFEVVDALLSQSFQQGSRLYQDGASVPVNQKLLSPGLPFERNTQSEFTQQQYEEYQKAIAQINEVYFPSLLDVQLTGYPESLFRDLQNELLRSFDHGEGISSGSPEIFRKGSISDERLAEIVHTYYQKMERLLDES